MNKCAKWFNIISSLGQHILLQRNWNVKRSKHVRETDKEF
jgi:hypothetical protein